MAAIHQGMGERGREKERWGGGGKQIYKEMVRDREG